MKIKKWQLVLLTLFLGMSTTAHTFEEDDDFDIFAIDDELADIVNNTDWEEKITRVTTPDDIVDDLNDLGLIEILKERLFKKSFPLNKVSLLDLPLMMPRWHCVCPTVKSYNIFWNQTTRANFAGDSTSISSYVDLENETIIAKLDDVINMINPGINIDITEILTLFKDFTVQERNFGIMCSYSKNFNTWRFTFSLPFYYHERNFFATDEERKILEERFGRLNQRDQEAFQSQHLISDKLGFGDTRFTFGFPVACGREYTVLFGVQATIPTAFALIKGLRGSSFEKNKKTRFANQEIRNIVNTALCFDPETAKELALNFALDALDHLAANLLDDKLGNNQHIGLGLFLHSKSLLSTFLKQYWARNIHFESWIALEYLFPSCENRFFVKIPDIAAFDAHDFTDPAQGEENLSFLEQALVDQLFPYVFPTRVQPGVIFKWTSKAWIPWGCWKLMLGTNMYLQPTESLSSIKIPSGASLSDFAINDAVKPLAFQSRLFGSLSYAFTRHRRAWNIALSAGATTFNSGIGDNFTVALNIETYF